MNYRNSKHWIICIAVASLTAMACAAVSAEMPAAKEYTNSIGMKLMRIDGGTFEMGQLKTPLPSEILPMFRGRGKVDCLTEGDYDEKPVHAVKITKPFYMGVFEVTNFQYELFDPEHKRLRGKDNGLSSEDDEAAINVNWYDAQAFCRWLSHKEGLPYRLPTEAEWEYACRAGTTSNYYAGDTLPEQFSKQARASLQVGQTPPNGRGLYDMHGNVEEWCQDWYGPYPLKPQTDPVGYIQGPARRQPQYTGLLSSLGQSNGATARMQKLADGLPCGIRQVT
jgi:formylglycine-generating enzyme required for sulfatase activity